jgi:hypothetical protein
MVIIMIIITGTAPDHWLTLDEIGLFKRLEVFRQAIKTAQFAFLSRG